MIPKLGELLDPKGFFAALWPYRYSSMVFGHSNAASINWRLTYAIAIVSPHLLLSYFVGYDHFKSRIREKQSDVQAFIAYFGFWFESTIVLTHVMMWLFVGHTCFTEVVSSLTLVDRELLQLCGRHANLRVMVIKQLVCTAVSVSVALTLILGEIFNQPKAMSWSDMFQIVGFYHTGIVTNVVMSVFGNLVSFVGDRYAMINFDLKGIIGKGVKKEVANLSRVVFDQVTLTRQFRIIHRKLFFVSRKLVEAFAFQAFTSILFIYTCTIYDLYEIYRIEVSPCGESTIYGLSLFIIKILSNFAIVIYVSWCCHKTVQEANETTKILNFLTTGSEDLRMEVASFSYQLMHYRLHFSPLGFFKLDLAFVQSMVGSMATYLVILVQLEAVPSECMTNRTASNM